jgi:hypothetical protein
MVQSADYPRDLVGYGRTPPHANWPGKARIAVQFVLNYEEGGENCVLHGDSHSEQFLSEIIGAAAFDDRHLSMESIYEYGSRAGVWRILNEFERRGLPLTVFGVAMALERHPELAQAFVELGHEVACHGWRWIHYQTIPEAVEREHLLDSYGMASRCRRVRAADIPVLELEANPDLALERIIEECLKAKQEDGIGAIVLGCGGMADLTPQISAAVGLPIVEGVTAAVKLAEALAGLGLQTSKHGDLDFPPPKPFTGRFAEYSNLTPD